MGASNGSVKNTRKRIMPLVGAVNNDKIIRANITKEYALSKTKRMLSTISPVIFNTSTYTVLSTLYILGVVKGPLPSLELEV